MGSDLAVSKLSWLELCIIMYLSTITRVVVGRYNIVAVRSDR